MLPNYNLAQRDLVQMAAGIDIAVPFYAVALSERLATRRVSIVYDFIREVFTREPWFAQDPPSDLGLQRMPPGMAILLQRT